MLRAVGLAFLVLAAAAASTSGEENSDEKVQITPTGGVEKASTTATPISLKKMAKLSFLAAIVGVGGADASTKWRTRPDDGWRRKYRGPFNYDLDQTLLDILEECEHIVRDDMTRTKRAVLKSMRGPGGVYEFYKHESTVWDRSEIPARYVSERESDLYLLGFSQYSRPSALDVRTAYRRAAMECHPDKMQNHQRAGEAKELFQRVKEAFDFLSSPSGK